MDGNSICLRCKSRVEPVEVVRGSLLVEVILWLFLLLPGLLSHLWVSGTSREICPECGSEDLVPVDSPRGKELSGSSA